MDKKQWHCTHTQPTEYKYGELQGSVITNISAIVERQRDGRWQWTVLGKPIKQGFEPDMFTAMDAAIKNGG